MFQECPPGAQREVPAIVITRRLQRLLPDDTVPELAG
jgi:hypothetical protein